MFSVPCNCRFIKFHKNVSESFISSVRKFHKNVSESFTKCVRKFHKNDTGIGLATNRELDNLQCEY